MYHPAQDVNHCVFRTLLLLEHTVHEVIELELYRLLDFYIVFPHMLKHIRPLPAELSTYRRLLAEIPDPFESMRNTKRII
ncbi:ABC-three component system middle component 5 [Nitrosomonas sp. Nm33]|uniref:ABC-three component system middle component 5 n=1 Tax=Nitrosomonas sp. Nm33 TaxID=133724 RepID=UPI000B87439D